MDIIVLAATASFIAGAVGYIIVRFWIMPVLRYRRLKHDIAASLEAYGKTDFRDRTDRKGRTGLQRTLRRHAARLSDSYYGDLPHWYRMALQSRGESPSEASKKLLGLPAVRDSRQALARMEEIGDLLRL
jgi:hypothetical protein